MKGRPYVHLRVRVAAEGGRSVTRTYWAVFLGERPGGHRAYRIVDREGQERSYERRDGTIVEELNVLLASQADILWERPAHMSLLYGWLVEGREPA